MQNLNIDLVKENYRSLSDNELIYLAREDSESLTVESFQLLIQELDSRGIDSNIIEQAQVDRELAEVVKVSETEKKIAADFTQLIWNQCLDMKEKGKTNEEIYNALISQNLSPEYAYMLIATIEPRMKEVTDETETENIVGWIFIGGGILITIFAFVSDFQSVHFIWGPIGILSGIVSLSNSSKRKKRISTILQQVNSEKEKNDSMYQ